MTRLTDEYHYSTPAFLGGWEEAWHGQAAQEQKAARYRTWLCSQGASRDAAAEQAVRVLAQEGHQFRPFPSPSAVSKLPGLQERARRRR